MLYRTPIGLPRVLRWALLYAALLPAWLVLFSVFVWLREGAHYLQHDFWAGLPWPLFWSVSLGLGVVLTVVALVESIRNNRRWQTFFHRGPLEALEPLGFTLDRYGLHGFCEGYPVSLHFEYETLGNYALISVYTPISDDVDALRALGSKHGKDWFFRFDAVEHFVDPPFEDADWPAAVARAAALAREEGFRPLAEHPWLPVPATA